MGARLLALVLFAIILFGGFGIARIIFVRHDPIGISAIIVALVLVAIFKRLATSRHPLANRVMAIPQSKWPINLARAARDSFEVFPGRPEGYVGYTDYTAMSVDVNDDLAARKPSEQFALLGFGNGFLQSIRDRLIDVGDRRVQSRVIDASTTCQERIGWLAYPTLAEFVRSLVLELAYRADLDVRDRAANAASLLRIAELKREVQAIEAEVDLPVELGKLIQRVYKWA